MGRAGMLIEWGVVRMVMVNCCSSSSSSSSSSDVDVDDEGGRGEREVEIKVKEGLSRIVRKVLFGPEQNIQFRSRARPCLVSVEESREMPRHDFMG